MLLPRGCPMYGLSHGCRQLAKYRVAVEKLRFPSKRPKFGGYKMSTKLRKSFVGHPSAILFSRISGEGVFQQPLALTLKMTVGILSERSGNNSSSGRSSRHYSPDSRKKDGANVVHQQLASESRSRFGPTIFRTATVTSKALDSFSDFEANREPATSSNRIYALVSISKTQQRGTSEEVSLMKNILLMTLFMLATLAWAAAQQFDSAPERNSGQAASPSSEAPGATQTQPSTPDGANQAGGGQASNAPVTEGCLGGSAPNFTITDKTGTSYRLNMPPNADTSKLASHVGESVQVQGDVKGADKPGNASIDVQGIGRGTGNCPASGSKDTEPPPKQ